MKSLNFGSEIWQGVSAKAGKPIKEKRIIMVIYSNTDLNLEIHPLDISRWSDFEFLFGDRGACGGCWCMSWR